MEELPFGVLAALAGLLAGVVLGLSARLGDFCTLGALESALYGDDQRRLRLWGVVLAVAIFGTHLGSSFGLIDIAGSYYHEILWNPLASIAGGLLFGYGMAMAGNCGFGALVRFGGGDLRSLVVVVVMGIFAFVALSGPLAPLRDALFHQEDAFGPQGITHDVNRILGISPLVTASLISLGLLAWALSYRGLRQSPRQLAWGVAAGLAVVWAFGATTWLSVESFGAVEVEGLSFTAPLGRTLIWLMTSTAGGISFSVGTVCGVMLGAFAGSLWRGLFRWEACEDPRELGRQVSGAAMMGVGGVTALGCSVGQGVSAFATLAWSGPVTLAAIAVGAVFGLRRLIGGFQPE